MRYAANPGVLEAELSETRTCGAMRGFTATPVASFGSQLPFNTHILFMDKILPPLDIKNRMLIFSMSTSINWCPTCINSIRYCCRWCFFLGYILTQHHKLKISISQATKNVVLPKLHRIFAIVHGQSLQPWTVSAVDLQKISPQRSTYLPIYHLSKYHCWMISKDSIWCLVN